MASSAKRRHDVVDLTGESDDNSHRHKVARHATIGGTLQSSQASSFPMPTIYIIEDEEEIGNELVDSTQSVNDSGVGFVLLGALDGKIVGVRYYDGYASPGEMVLVRREPTNPYDRNAIRIDNVQGNQIGHIPRNIAAKLAPYMDDRSLIVEGVLTGEKSQFDCPIRLRLFGTSEPVARAELEARMKADKLPVSKQKKEPKPKKTKEIVRTGRKKMGLQGPQNNSGFGQELEDAGPNLGDLMSNSDVFRPRQMEELAEQWGTPEEMLAKMPLEKQPTSLEAKLLPYQLQGLAWMLKMENPVLPSQGSTDVVQLWKRSSARQNMFMNVATNFNTTNPPKLAKGGILADDMGLGKTIQIISLITEGGPGPTLIVAPLSVMSNWSQQIERHVKTSNTLRVLTYHGSGRKTLTSAVAAEYDVVITTYGMLSQEHIPNPKNGVHSVQWKRIVLDEGHTIRNPSTRAAVAATSIQAECRWILTGTPIVNTIKDLHSMLKFLHISGGLERLDIFNAILTRPLGQGDHDADILLQTIMRSMCLRRKKEMKFVDLRLPELTEYVHRIEFRKDEREKYKALQSEAEGALVEYQARHDRNSGEKWNSYRHLLEILLRLRQVCNHWKLCGTRIEKLMALLESEKVVVLNDEGRLALQAYLQLCIENSDECPICLERLHNPVITACKHAFGYECIERTITEQHKCPMCRAELASLDQLVKPAVEQSDFEDPDIDVNTKSSKTEALMSILKASRRDKLSKVVIFSQWTSFLNIIQHQLDEAGYKYTRIDGTMPAAKRDAAMTALESDQDTKILLASLSVCSVGLNLVAADTVILADSWWAPAIEDQAVDRVHRLGQTRPTTVWRLVMENSIEERVLDIQKEKRQLVGKAFREKGKGGQAKTRTVADIQQLLR